MRDLIHSHIAWAASLSAATAGPRRQAGWSNAAVVLVAAGMMIAVPPQSSRAMEDLGPYQVIVDRHPFGVETVPVVVSNAAPTAASLAESYLHTLKLTGVAQGMSGGLFAGFVDPKGNKSYFLQEGDSQDDIEVVKVSLDKEAALLRKNPEEVWLYMNAADAAAAASNAMAAAAAAAPKPVPSFASRLTRPTRTAAAARGSIMTREQYEKFRRTVPPPVPPRYALQGNTNIPQLQGEELQKYLQEYNMDLIRAGGERGPALPIPLTPEQDAQLVKEGVLPPQDAPPDQGAAPQPVPQPAPEE